MGVPQPGRSRLSPMLFIAGGIAWGAIIVAGGGPLLFWPALASILSGALLLFASANPVTRPLAAASSVYGLAISLYQLFLAVPLTGSQYAPAVAATIGVFIAFVILYLILLAYSLTVKRAEVSPA